MYPEQIPEVHFDNPGGFTAYVFRDCKLYLSRLPGKSFPLLVGGVPSHLGKIAFAVNVLLVLDEVLDENGVSDTDIIDLQTANCRFQIELQKQPARKGQELLTAALKSPKEGTISIKLN